MWYRHDLQAWASALLIFKTLGFAILLNAYQTDTAWSQVWAHGMQALQHTLWKHSSLPH